MVKKLFLMMAISVLILASLVAPSVTFNTSAGGCIRSSTQSAVSSDGSTTVWSNAAENVCANPVQADGYSQYKVSSSNLPAGYTPIGVCGNFYNFQYDNNYAFGYQNGANSCNGFTSVNFSPNTLYTVNYPIVYGGSVGVLTQAFSGHSTNCQDCSTASVTA